MNVCFLPGSLCDARVFSPQLQAATNAAHYCGVLDLGGLTSIEAMATRVIDATEPGVVLVGISMGAIVAVEAAAQAPGHVGALALFDTNLDAPDELQLNTRTQWASQVRSGGFAQLVADSLTDALTHFPDRNRQLIFDMAIGTTPGGFLDQNTALLNRPDRRDHLGGFDGPVLVAVGANDEICPADAHVELAERCAAASLHVIDDAGHLSTIDQPDAVNALLVAWLEKCNNQFHTQEGIHEYHYA